MGKKSPSDAKGISKESAKTPDATMKDAAKQTEAADVKKEDANIGSEPKNQQKSKAEGKGKESAAQSQKGEDAKGKTDLPPAEKKQTATGDSKAESKSSAPFKTVSDYDPLGGLKTEDLASGRKTKADGKCPPAALSPLPIKPSPEGGGESEKKQLPLPGEGKPPDGEDEEMAGEEGAEEEEVNQSEQPPTGGSGGTKPTTKEFAAPTGSEVLHQYEKPGDVVDAPGGGAEKSNLNPITENQSVTASFRTMMANTELKTERNAPTAAAAAAAAKGPPN